MREHHILNSGSYLEIVDIATLLCIIITSTKEDRKLLAVMTMESRCRICPVIRKILQSWHSLRTERATANSWGQTLQSGMCHRLPTTNVPLALRLWYPPVAKAMASALLGKSPPEAHDSLHSSVGHIHVNVCGTVHHFLPSPVVQARQIIFSSLREEVRCSPFYP